MPGTVLIPRENENGRGVKTYGVNSTQVRTMRSTLFCLAVFTIYLGCAAGELEFYPDFRRPDPILKWENEKTAEEYALEQFTSYLQEQQRRLAMQQRQRQPDFTYSVPASPANLEDAEFGVAPPDPRYYQPSPDDEEFISNDFDPEDQQQQQSYFQQQPDPYQPDQQQLFLQQQNQNSQPPSTLSGIERSPIDPLVVKTRTEDHRPVSGGAPHIREQDLSRLASGSHRHADHTVDITPVKATTQDDTAGVYIIAVVAGISAAATVGLIAFAIGWYNLQKNVKNATDVEYPAYGVTGPNKDVSPTGDRRLAQSAQMYHYQHQKQQIIAMESRAAATVRHGSMSEAESDEENEEGDYTVYECPGLAPAGEMEVKNPLFQDDPTPASQPSTKNDESVPDQK